MTDKKRLGYLSAFKTIMLGGEAFPPDMYAELGKYTDAEVWNVYGPAETTVWSSCARIDGKDINIGHPVANTRLYILGGDGSPMPVGEAGELCISGSGVCGGYIGQPELSAEKFSRDPFAGDNAAMYRTGDLALRRADGSIEFLGRMDAQIKINGMRIEPAEIESVMTGFDGVELAAVSLSRDAAGRSFLTGFYTAADDIDERALRLYLNKKLPAYMTPNYFRRLEKMPLTPSGKLDRKALPKPHKGVAERGYAPPVTREERVICELLARLLDIEKAGAEDDFFELGGDSLIAMELVAEAQRAGVRFSIKDVYRYRTARELCANAELSASGNKTAAHMNRYPEARTRSDLRLFGLFRRFSEKAYGLETAGLDNIAHDEKYIFCPNHESDLDCLWVWAALSGTVDLNDTCALIAAEHLDKPLHRRVFRLEGGIPLDRSGDFAPAMRRALRVITRGKRYILIHPEGTRTRTGELGKFKRGAALLSLKTGIRIVPVCIIGARELFPPDRAFPALVGGHGALKIKFGAPISPDGKTDSQLTEEIRARIEAMRADEI